MYFSATLVMIIITILTKNKKKKIIIIIKVIIITMIITKIIMLMMMMTLKTKNACDEILQSGEGSPLVRGPPSNSSSSEISGDLNDTLRPKGAFIL